MCQLTLQQRGTLYPTNLWVQAHFWSNHFLQQPLFSVGPWQAEMGQYRNVSPRGTGSFMSGFQAYKLFHLGKTKLSKALTPSRNSMELRSIHLPQPQEQAKGQTGGRDIAKIFPDLKGPVLFYSHFCCTQGSPWPKTHSRLQRYSLAQQDKTRSGHGNCMRSLILFSQLLQSKALDFWLLEVNKRTSQGFTNSIFWTSELTISVFDLASTACLVFFSMNFCFWNRTRKMKKVECMTTHQLFVIIYFKPFIP